jgi:hypothetical protein
MPKRDIVFELSPTQNLFVHADEEVVILHGPMGEGKTYAGIVGCVAHAARCGKNIRGALVRDTLENIKRHNIPDFAEVLGDLVSFHDDYKKIVIHTTPRVEIHCFGVDDPGSLNKFQGFIGALIWLEEPAPIADKANAGLSKDVFDFAIARASRQAGTFMRVQMTQNPADEDHWSEAVAQGPDILGEDPDTGFRIRKAFFRIPYGENSNLNPQTRAANWAAFAHDPGKKARYIEGVAAPVQFGKAVTPKYSRAIHFAPEELPVFPGVQGIRGWDGWHNATCGIFQFVSPGRLILHDVLTGDGAGVKELIKDSLKPLLATGKYKNKILDWRDIGDPSMRTPDQSSVKQSSAKVVERLLGTRFEPGPVRWRSRIDPLRSVLGELASDGSPKLYISKSAYLAHRALNGGWHFKVDNRGHVIGGEPVKDEHSHVGDMISYVVAEIFPYARNQKKQLSVARNIQRRLARRAMAYGGAPKGAEAAYGKVR